MNITTNFNGKVFGQIFSNELFNVTWNVTDADNDTLTYAILFSANNGGNYTTLEDYLILIDVTKLMQAKITDKYINLSIVFCI